MNIWQAIELMKDRRYVRREGWPGITYIFLIGDIIYRSHLGIDDPWTPTHKDLLTADYIEIIPER